MARGVSGREWRAGGVVKLSLDREMWCRVCRGIVARIEVGSSSGYGWKGGSHPRSVGVEGWRGGVSGREWRGGGVVGGLGQDGGFAAQNWRAVGL
jgi:hypothetical protein